MRFSLLLIALILHTISQAQPSTEVYLFEISEDGLSNPVNISANDGYDNQPSFWPDSKSVLYARTINGQTEIARYFIESKKTVVITSTLQGSEYSPTPIPGTSDISSVRLDSSGLQLLYRYDLDGNSEVLVADLKIGYHAWISPAEIVTFVLGEPSTMRIINTVTKNTRIVADSIGRSLHKIPNSNNFSFVDKTADQWIIKSMISETGETKEISNVVEGSEDYCWTPGGKILMAKEATIYELNSIEGWVPLWDVQRILGIDGIITRIAVSADGKMLAAVVGN